MRIAGVSAVVLLALAAAPMAVWAQPPGGLFGLSSFARCYKFAVRQANNIEMIRTRAAAQVCDGKSLDLAAAQANLSTNHVIRHINSTISGFAGSGPAACDADLFDGEPLPPFPVAEEDVGVTRELLAFRTRDCDGGGGEQPFPE